MGELRSPWKPGTPGLLGSLDCLSVRSAGWASAEPAATRIECATDSSCSRERATSKTLAPAAARSRAVASPMPKEAPVISTVLPSTALCNRLARGAPPGLVNHEANRVHQGCRGQAASVIAIG